MKFLPIFLLSFLLLLACSSDDDFNAPTVIKKYYIAPSSTQEDFKYVLKVRTIVNGIPQFKDYEVPIAMYDCYEVDDKVIDWGQQ